MAATKRSVMESFSSHVSTIGSSFMGHPLLNFLMSDI